VRRTIARRSPHALQALRTLLAGPSRKERAAGIISAIPPDARVLSLSFRGRGGTEAVVELTGLPPVMGVRPGRSPSVITRIRVITQVARTVIGLSGIERIRVRVDGRLWDQPTHEGGIVDAATDYDRLLGWWRVCAGQRTAEERARGLVRCFAALP
jgi:spore germination protein GerM